MRFSHFLFCFSFKINYLNKHPIFTHLTYCKKREIVKRIWLCKKLIYKFSRVQLKNTCSESFQFVSNAFKQLEWNENRKVVRFYLDPIALSSSSGICGRKLMV